MPQLVNQRCGRCGERIESDSEGTFCSLCGIPVHDHCKNPEIVAPGRCLACGCDNTDEAAVQKRLRQLEESASERFRQKILRGDDERWGETRARARAEVFYGIGLLALGTMVGGVSLLSNGPTLILCSPFLFGLILLARGLTFFWHS